MSALLSWRGCLVFVNRFDSKDGAVMPEFNSAETGRPPIRIVIADNHPIARYGLNALLVGEPDFKVIGEAENGRQALDHISELNPDILLLELQMPVLDGFSALQILHGSNHCTKTIVLTGSDQTTEFVRCMKLGAAGVIRKQASGELIVKSIRKVHSGEIWLDSELTVHVLRQFVSAANPEGISPRQLLQRNPTSARELEIVKLIAQGFRNKEIADNLFISEQTVKNHLHSVFRKLGVSDRLSLALYAVHQGLLETNPEPVVHGGLGETEVTARHPRE